MAPTARDLSPPVRLPRLEKVLLRDRLIVLFALAAIIAISWRYLAVLAANMRSMSQMPMPMNMPGMAMPMNANMSMNMPGMSMANETNFMSLFAMWSVMMVAMMLPSVTPNILLVLGVYRRRGSRYTRAKSLLFIAGYLLAWTAFSAVAAASQMLLHRAALLTPEMAARSMFLAAMVLIVAGVYQWLPLKRACLAHCHSPLGFLTRYWREGSSGAIGMGVRHGLFCVGCCWALMALLFVAGVMNLLWIAAIAAFVLVEKLAPPALRLSRFAGIALAAWGAYLLAHIL